MLADRVRRELAAPVSVARLVWLSHATADALEQVENAMAQARRGLSALSPASRKAYEFLKGVNFASVRASSGVQVPSAPPRSVSYRGLSAHMQRLLDRLADTPVPESLGEIHQAICQTSRRIEQDMARHATTPEQLKPETHALRGWLAYFCDPENMAAYLRAVSALRERLELAVTGTRKLPAPRLVHFLPLNAIYRYRTHAGVTRVCLPTPMICFGEAEFALLADMMVRRGRHRQAIIQAMCSAPYQAIQAELNRLSGELGGGGGLHRNLQQAFDRVNAEYFAGLMEKPRLTWSRSFTLRKFGHYDHIHDTVMVSSTLDDPRVPEFVLDFIVYHELLHKKMDVRWSNGRSIAHWKEFRAEERKFLQYEQARTALRQLARG